MSLAGFIPAIWSANILANLRNDHVYAQPGLTNRNYEGEITGHGDRVKINSIGRITTFDYTRNVDMPAPEVLTESQRELVIDAARGFNFYVDDIDKAQTMPKVMAEATAEAADSLAEDADTYLGALYVEGQTPLGTAAAPIELTPADAYDLIVDLDVKLRTSKVKGPRAGVVPPWFYGLVRKDPRFVEGGGAQAEALLRNGVIGMVGGVTLTESTNVPTVTDGTAGVSHVLQVSTIAARSYAEQIVQTENYRPERRFGDAVKGLHVYGGKIVRPEALVSAIAQPASA